MAIHKSDYAKGARQMPVAQGAEILSVKLVVPVPASVANGDVLEFGELPADHVPVDWILDSDAIDAGNTATLDVGILNAAGNAISTAAADGGDEWVDGSTLVRAGGMVRDISGAVRKTAAKSDGGKMVAGVVAAAVGTGQAGNVSLTLFYRAAHFGA